LIVVIPLALAIYFLPTMMALTRGRYRHGNPVRVFWINLLTGWTVIGWMAGPRCFTSPRERS
jgi:hypothetical protein